MPYASMNNVIGIVLAGGNSSRMGENKAHLLYEGRSLLDHMINLLGESGCAQIYVSGDYKGYACLEDHKPGAGPAAAMADIINRFSPPKKLVFVPVDMPFLTPDLLSGLMGQSEGAFYADKHFPAMIPAQDISQSFEGQPVMSLFDFLGMKMLDVSSDHEALFANINTPEQWADLVEL